MTDQYRENIDSSAEQNILDSENKEDVKEFVDSDANILESQNQNEEVKEYVDMPESTPEQELDVPPVPEEKPIEYRDRPDNLDLMETKEVLDRLTSQETQEVGRVKLNEFEEKDKKYIKHKQDDAIIQGYESGEISEIADKMSIDMQQKQQVETIFKIAEDQGLEKALKTLQKVKDPEVVDLVHDLFATSGIYKRFKE